MKKVVSLVFNNFKNDTRVLKECQTLQKEGYYVQVVALHEGNLPIKERTWGVMVNRIHLRTRCLPKNLFGQLIKYFELNLKAGLFYQKTDIIHCNDLGPLPIAVLMKLFSVGRIKIVYDAHELETEVCGMSRIRKILSKVLEKLLIYYIDSIIVVSDSIAEWYKNQYNLRNIHVIKNVPYRVDRKSEHSNILKETFYMQDNEILYVYQGALGNGRGIEILLNVFSKVDEKKHIVFMGYGDLEDTIKKYENKFSNIHFHPAVKPEEIMSYAKSADVGICLIENICLSYFYSLPNKLFEYIASGLPVIVSNFPEMGKIVDENKCGWKISVDEASLIDLIESISNEDIKEKRDNVLLNCRSKFDWHQEERNLLKVYSHLRQ